jgi:hypothetical protein
MPKSRHGRGKHPHRSKKSKAMRRQAGIPLPSQATAVAPKPSAPAEAPPAPKTVAAPAVVTAPQYPYIAGELKRIAILAGIIIVALIVLSIVIP